MIAANRRGPAWARACVALAFFLYRVAERIERRARQSCECDACAILLAVLEHRRAGRNGPQAVESAIVNEIERQAACQCSTCSKRAHAARPS